MKTKLTITDKASRTAAIRLIESLPFEPVHSVDIQEYKRNRSLEANALYWKWLTVIGNELGESKDELHEDYKNRWLVSIFERDNPEYAEMIQSLRNVYRQGMHKEALALRKRIVALTSTTDCNTAQMSEYMTQIERHAASLNIRLPHPTTED